MRVMMIKEITIIRISTKSEISFEDDAFYTKTFGEVLELNPILNFDLSQEGDRYTYLWKLNDETREGWDQPTLKWEIDEVVDRGKISLEITDHKYGVSYLGYATLSVVGIYENARSWMILSEVGGKSQLSYFNMLEYDSEVDTIISSRITLDVYGMSNDGAELGQGRSPCKNILEKVLIGMKILLAMSVFFKRVVRWI